MAYKTITGIFTSKVQEDIIGPLGSGRRRGGSFEGQQSHYDQKSWLNRSEWNKREIGYGTVSQRGIARDEGKDNERLKVKQKKFIYFLLLLLLSFFLSKQKKFKVGGT